MESLQKSSIKVNNCLCSYEIVNLVKSKKALAERMRNSSTAPIQMTLL
jgi:hypothetical protein